jgi:hypothetical protein
MAYYAQLSQVGIEMAAPIGIGALIDRWGQWEFPVASTIGAVIGLVGGIFHLVILGRRESEIAEDPENEIPGSPKETP